MKKLIFYNKAGGETVIKCQIVEKKDGPTEVLIYDVIGKDWDGRGFDARDFAAHISALDPNSELRIRVNSRGGIVDEGIAIYNRIRQWKGKTVAVVDGAAASIASVLIMGADEVHVPRSAEVLIHDAHTFAGGNAADMRDIADRLDQVSDRIAEIYAEKTGKTAKEMRDLMRATTVFTGQQAVDIGLADKLTEETPMYNFSSDDISRFKVGSGINNNTEADANQGSGSTPQRNQQMRKKIIALLNKLGIKFENTATDEQLLALLPETYDNLATATTNTGQAGQAAASAAANSDGETIRALRDSLTTINNRLEAERRGRVVAAVDQLVQNNQLPGAQRDRAIARAMADETILDEYRALPSVPPGEPALSNLVVTSEDPREVGKVIVANFATRPGEIMNAEQARERGQKRAYLINKHLNKLIDLIVLNSNTVSTDLKRTVILQQMIRAFAIKILNLNAFSTTFNGVRLEGTDKVAVPYFPLITTASTDFVAGNGYNTFMNTNSDAKTVTVDKRKYQGLQWTSSELARQPFMNIGMAAMLVGEQLGQGVVNDVLSIILAGTYTATAFSQPASAFDSDDVMDLKGRGDSANWPAGGRSLIINSAYDVNLLKDNAIKNAMAFGDNAPIREGRIVRIGGFDYYPDSRVPANAENLQGMISFKSALLVAFSPVNPTAEVRQQLTRYEQVIEPETGVQFEYRMWGDPDMDRSNEIIESNFGKAAGEPAALIRITS